MELRGIGSEYGSRGTTSPKHGFERRLCSGLRAPIALVGFLAAWTILNIIVNVRYPGSEDRYWYLMPSIDVTAMLVVFAIVGLSHRTIPLLLHWSFALFCLFVRVFRIGDGIDSRYNSRAFNLYFELPLLPELLRLVRSTTSTLVFSFGVAITLVGFLLVTAVSFRCSRYAAAVLSRRRFSCIFLSVIGVLAAAAPMGHFDQDRVGTFAASIVPRLVQEGDLLFHGAQYRALVQEDIARVQRNLERIPNDLAKLERSNVFLVFVESYGVTLLQRDVLRAEMRSLLGNFDTETRRRGFFAASSLVESPTYGGASWLAQTTLATGVKVNNQFRYRIVVGARPRTLADFFGSAGYRTVLVQPGTTRPWPEGEFYHFDTRYFAWQFGYRGPKFSWAPMPDQYVLEYIRKREVAAAVAPLFIQCALVSSHAPWDVQPPFVEDATTIGNGEVYHTLRRVEFDTSWSNMKNAGAAYLRSVSYDFDVLLKYLKENVSDSSLFIILGDHQPNGDVTGQSPSFAVPIHVISRREANIRPFIERGYALGMVPPVTQPSTPMERFMPEFLADFSRNTKSAPSQGSK